MVLVLVLVLRGGGSFFSIGVLSLSCLVFLSHVFFSSFFLSFLANLADLYDLVDPGDWDWDWDWDVEDGELRRAMECPTYLPTYLPT